jgi:hypothetical protein
MSEVFLHVGAEGAVLVGAHAMAVEEAPGPGVAMPENPDEVKLTSQVS